MYGQAKLIYDMLNVQITWCHRKQTA